MKIETSEDMIFAASALIAIVTFQGMLLVMILMFWFVWEDSKWPAFDSDDFDNKMRKGPLNPWKKGN